ncbi:hypothetical protein EHQ61_00740 [Leptospira wolffii]|uniref:hypothetical protein n=1 Tax=Leptospira wolffii TaxID=409998 RepID=UPI00108335EC|nr:hypothetical protein [Leptospira wolffii]TGL55270.1 hypothetical protein EHQ61_00740 [Leptospira wolffii]
MDIEAIRADLKISLYAGDTLVAESTDPVLWQSILRAMSKKTSSIDNENSGAGSGLTDRGPEDPVLKMAYRIGISPAELEGALTPSKEAPFITLDMRYYEDFTKNFPTRGPNSINGTKLAATALCIWSQESQLGDIRVSNVDEVLSTIHLTDKNTYRSISNTEWLRIRSGIITINPAMISRAYDLLQKFCTKRGPGA